MIELSKEQRDRVAAVLEGDAAISTLLTPEELHVAANAWNWDGGVDGVRQIVERADCALATAALVFWRSLPDEVIGFYADRDSAEEEDGQGDTFDLQLLIRDRVAAGGYANHDIGFDPSDDDGTDWSEDYPEEPAHELPAALLGAVPGRLPDPELRF